MLRIPPLEKALPDDLRRMIRDHPVLTIVAGAVLGFYLGRNHGREVLSAVVGAGVSAGMVRAKRMLGVEDPD